MKCPQDQSKLIIKESEGHIGYLCEACASMWLPLTYIEAIKHWRTWFSDAEFARKLNEATRRLTASECPAKCGRLSAAFFDSIEVDWCQRCHGVWFDKGELRKALEVNRPKSQGSGWEGADILSPLISELLSGLF